jgi:hypothetical protein
LDKASTVLREAISLMDTLSDASHIAYELPSISLAGVLWERGEIEAGRTALTKVNAESLSRFPNHVGHADYLRIAGLMAIRDGDSRRGIEALKGAHAILERTLGPNNWRTRRAKEELARAAGDG